MIRMKTAPLVVLVLTPIAVAASAQSGKNERTIRRSIVTSGTLSDSQVRVLVWTF